MLILLLLFAATVNGNSSPEAVIDHINTALSKHDEKALAAQFTPDADFWMEGKKIQGSRDGIISTFKQHQPWSQSSTPQLQNVDVVSTSAAKAVVRADEVRLGSVATRIASLELILVHRNETWLVDSVRVLSIGAGAH